MMQHIILNGIYGNIQPTQLRNPNHGNGYSNVEPTVNLSWTKSIDFNGDSYDVYLSKSNSPKKLIAYDIEKLWIIVKGLKKDTRYSWKVIARDEYGSQYSSDRWIFTVRPPLPQLSMEFLMLKLIRNILSLHMHQIKMV